MNKTIRTVLIAVLAVILVGGGIFVGINWNNWFGRNGPAPATESASADVDTDAQSWQGEQKVYTGEKNTDTIDIPGYGSITLQADTAEQTVNFNNPEQNTCYFQMSLLLSDGTQLWKSKLVEPGKGLYNITLEQTLPAGTYENATLKYECFAMDDARTPLNGSEIKLSLNVIK